VTNEDHDEERDPLLVRPYLLSEGGDASPGEKSTQTWPAATTREVRSQHALEGADDETAVLILPAEQRPPRQDPRHGTRLVPRLSRRRLLVVIAACAAVLLGAAAAGLAALRPGGRPSVSAALPDAPIPALAGLVPPLTAASPTAAGASPSLSRSASRRATSTTAATGPAGQASRTPTKATSAPAGSATASSAAVTPGKTTAPPAALAPGTSTDNRTGTIRGQNGLCLDLNGAVAVDFNHIQVYDCNNTAAQSWTLATDGTLRVLGMCALIVGDDSVRVTGCDTRTTAQWRVSGQLLINAANNKCLTDPSSGATSGAAVKVTTCNGGANQRWSLP
jgi:hypothetical protein